jgi:hypothetical protein
MKNIKLLFFIFAFAKANTIQAQVFMDRINAPENPMGVYEGTYAAKNLKGNVYYADFMWYDKNKKQIGENAIPEEWDPKNRSPYYVKTENGLIVEQGKLKDTIYYTYDAKKRLLSEKGTYWNYEFQYDAMGRVIQKIAVNKDKVSIITTTSYKKIGDELQVKREVLENGTSRIVDLVYKNGLVVFFESQNNKSTKSYDFDAYGNYVKTTNIDANGKVYIQPREIIYWHEVNEILTNKKLDWESSRVIDKTPIYSPYVQIKGRRIKYGISPAYLLNYDAAYYLDAGKTYLRAVKAYTTDRSNTGKGTARILTQGHEALFQYKDKLMVLLDRGDVVKNASHNRLGDDYYVVDTVSQIHYLIKDYQKSKDSFTPAIKKTGNHSFYGRNLEKKTVSIFLNGKTPDYRYVDFSNTVKGEKVMNYYGKPILVLTGYEKEIGDQIFEARPYAGEQINEGAAPVENLPEHDSNIALFVRRKNGSEYNTVQNNQLVQQPLYFEMTAKGDNLLIGYDQDIYALYGFREMKDGIDHPTTKISEVMDIVVEYIDGQVSYFYLDGIGLKQDKGYVSSTILEGKMLVYFPQLKKSAIVDKVKPVGVFYVAAGTTANNDLLKITETGAIPPFVNGKFLSQSDYKFYKDAAGNAHIYINEKPVYYLAGFDSKPKPSIQPLEKHTGQTYVREQTDASSKPNTSTTTSLSQKASAFLIACKATDGKEKMKQILADMDKSLIDRGMSEMLRAEMFAILFKELYTVDKEAAFQVTMRMPREIKVHQFMSSVTLEQRDFLKTRARKMIGTYQGSHSNTKQ